MPLGNLMMSAAILFSGSMIEQALRLFDVYGIARISRATYFRHQAKYLEPTIVNTWEEERSAIIENLREQDLPLCLAGDSRADSPGKYSVGPFAS